ncbi:hypothetical protein VC83_07271 [Pseudogymnoascus destructans]|uniref:Uncharacterized protein n=1 Tax=Pseudogymnoascus destructans TaxID=655981 RepID=A0A177A374_9PEZI|nr:uncharacterized protein VC83_07271 [Pseudogymnoascus destructans]OAF56715.1 hypothetical protein VC83_07271 [Pseudogymnoascus destructans]
MALSAFCAPSLQGKTFKPSVFHLGRFGVMMAVITFIWNGFAFAVLCAPQYGNSSINADAGLFNYAIVIMAGVTVIGLEQWWRKSSRVWFHNIKDIDNRRDQTFRFTQGWSKQHAPLHARGSKLRQLTILRVSTSQ